MKLKGGMLLTLLKLHLQLLLLQVSLARSQHLGAPIKATGPTMEWKPKSKFVPYTLSKGSNTSDVDFNVMEAVNLIVLDNATRYRRS